MISGEIGVLFRIVIKSVTQSLSRGYSPVKIGIGNLNWAVWLFSVFFTLIPFNNASASDLFTNHPTISATDIAAAGEPNPTVIQERPVLVNGALLTSMADQMSSAMKPTPITLNLFPNVAFDFAPARSEISPSGKYTVVSGSLTNGRPGMNNATFVFGDGVVTANIRPGWGSVIYQLRISPSGIQIVQEVDTNRIPMDEKDYIVPDSPPDSFADTPPSVSSYKNAQSPSFANAVADDRGDIKIMVVYTPATRTAAGGLTGIQHLIDMGIAETNQSFANSGVTTRLSLAHSAEVNYTEGPGLVGFKQAMRDLEGSTDGYIDEIHTLRNTYAADLVSLWINNISMGGLGSIPTPPSDKAIFTTVYQGSATGNFVFTHEVGHNLGGNHDVYQLGRATGNSAYVYSHGYVDTVNRFYTIMAYPDKCRNNNPPLACTKIGYWSSPANTYFGAATGDSATADMALSNNNMASTVANWRHSSVTLGVVRKNSGGTVTANSGAINCGATCSGVYQHNATVTLTAVPNAGYAAGEWTGCQTASGNTCTVGFNSIDPAYEVGVTFVAAPTSAPSLSVVIFPEGAVTAGAQWSVDGGVTWRNSTDTISGLVAGATKTVSFKTTTGWIAPASQTVNITAGQNTVVKGTYHAPGTGGITVTILPAEAVALGRWSVDGGVTWHKSGETVFGLPVTVTTSTGTNWTIVTLKGITGFGGGGSWASARINEGQNTAHTSSYTYTTLNPVGTVVALLSPPAAVTAGSQWSIDGGVMWNNNEVRVNNLAPGVYTATFKSLTGWITPPSQQVTVTSGRNLVIGAAYYQTGTGGITVTTQPLSAWNSGGVRWSVDNGNSTVSGDTVFGLAPGAHTVHFSQNVPNWIPPADQTVNVTAGQTTSVVGTYIQKSTGSVKVWLYPLGAVTAGAQWSVDGGVTWSNDDAIVSNLAPGSKTLLFKSITGWVPPVSQTVTVTAGQTTPMIGVYTPFTASPPTVTTNSATSVTMNSATLNGVVNANNASTSVTFQYGVTTAYGSTVTATQSPLSSALATAVSAPITGLSCGATYHYRAVGASSGGTTNGADASFTTSACAGQAGLLTVAITPAGAVAAGAQWRVDGGVWQASGATVSSLTTGSHTVSFSAATGYTTPSSQTVTVMSGQTASVAGIYRQQGSLTVNISPVGAVTAGAQWRVNGGAWQSSGATISTLIAGSPTVSFSSVAGYTAPASQVVPITGGGTSTVTGTYTAITASTGSLSVTISPAGAVTAGAQWRVDGGAWQASGATVTRLTAGRHTVSFDTVPGYTSPANKIVTIVLGQTVTSSGIYSGMIGSGSLKVSISPAGAVAAGAQWSVDSGTTWNANGATVTGLTAGSHLVSFSAVADYTSPEDRVVKITNGATAIATGMYKQNGSLRVTILPAGLAGAQWSVDNGTTWNASGDTVTGLTAGKQTVAFKTAVTGYSPPADKAVMITPGRTATATGTYTAGYNVLAKASTGGTATPAKTLVTDVSDTATVTIAVTPKTGYTTSATVGGTCAAGSFSGTTYTTGAVTEACTAMFTFTKAPTVTSGSATNIMQAGATLNARVNPENDSTTVTFEYVDDVAYLVSATYPLSVSAGVLTGGVSQAVAAPVAGLTCNTKYHFRVKAVNGDPNSPKYGLDRTFKTAACLAPTAVTIGASGITATSVTLKGAVNPNKASTTVTFEYVADSGTAAPTTYGSTVSVGVLTGGGSKLVSVAVTGLTCGTKYHFRVKAVNAVNPTNGIDKTFTTTMLACADRAADSNMVKALVSDLDGDGKSDIVFRDVVSGQTAVWMMDGVNVTSNALTSMSAGSYTSTTGWQAQGIGDFDGDGKNDLLWRDAESGHLAVWTMNGATVVSSANTSVNPSAGWKVQGIGDFNGDGKSDILFRNATTGETSVWFMNGAVRTDARRTSSTAGAYTSTTGWQVHGVGDFNGDGKSDILWRHAGTGKTVVWFMNGATVTSRGLTTVQAGSYTTTTGWQVQGAGDFNGDAKADILLRSAETGRMAIWMMDGAKVAKGSYTSVDAGVYTSTAGLHVSAIADYNGDGKSDILLRDAETGQTRVWLMNGSQALSDTATDVNPGAYTPAAGWSVVSEGSKR